MNEDESHLQGLAVAHYVVGGILVLFACIPLVHTFIGLAMIGEGDVRNARKGRSLKSIGGTTVPMDVGHRRSLQFKVGIGVGADH